jgi:hypothetical protein
VREAVPSRPRCRRPCCRCIAVHPSQPYILTCSDDMLIKLWDWDKVRNAAQGEPQCCVRPLSAQRMAYPPPPLPPPVPARHQRHVAYTPTA